MKPVFLTQSSLFASFLPYPSSYYYTYYTYRYIHTLYYAVYTIILHICIWIMLMYTYYPNASEVSCGVREVKDSMDTSQHTIMFLGRKAENQLDTAVTKVWQ